MSLSELDNLLSWFQRQKGKLDEDAMGFTIFPPHDGGRGAVALKDIEARTVLSFSLRLLYLWAICIRQSTRCSQSRAP